MLKGFIKFWNDDKGFGFISCGTHQYFLHHSNFQKGRRPVAHCRVVFELGPGRRPRTEQAINVYIDDTTPQDISPAVVAGFEDVLKKNAGGVE